MKKLSYLIIVAFIGMLNAAEKNKSVYPDAIAPTINFEVINKSKGSIGILLNTLKRIGDYYLLDAKLENMQTNTSKIGGDIVVVPTGSTFSTQISLGQETNLKIAREIKPTKSGTSVPSGIEIFTINAPGKTRFFTYNGDKKEADRLYPQTGPLKGLGKFTPNFIAQDVTNTGLLKRNNIDAKDILRKNS